MSVQLARSSLAMVLGVREAASRPDLSGQQLLAQLKAENRRNVWDGRLVQAVSGLLLLGCLDSSVLLLGGSASHLQVLREAWSRRALRAPRGFRIKAMGDVPAIPMKPIPQSQFVPLAEVLCCVISEMNANRTVVTQEALLEYLVECYPGIATPSQEIVHSALGSLIQERKIYHTGEGYFIVTPQTYFIAGSMGMQRQPWVLHEESAASPDRVIYLVSVESSQEPLQKERVLPDGAPHCKSCRCFSQPMEKQQADPRFCKNSPGQRSCKEHKPAVQHRATSTAFGPRRAKEKGIPIRKFSLSLFRRNKKKDSPKRAYGTFSAQFPPEEWPVRDENSVGNIPRDVEHQLIKRINPGLTVENLVRHTLMMKKLGRESTAQFHGSGSLDQLIGKHHSEENPQKTAAKLQQQHRKMRSSREKKRLKSKGSLQLTKGLPKPGNSQNVKELAKHRSEGEQMLFEEQPTQACRSSIPITQLHQKRIDDPFTKGKHYFAQNTIINNPRLRQRSQSVDSSSRGQDAVSVREIAPEKFHPNTAAYLIRPAEEGNKEQLQSHDVRTECRNQVLIYHNVPTGCESQDHLNKNQTPGSPQNMQTSNHTHSCAQQSLQEQESEEFSNVTRPEISHEYEDSSVPQSLCDRISKQGQNSTTVKCASMESLSSLSPLSDAQRMSPNQAQQSEGETASQPETNEERSEAFTDEDQALYQRELDEDDACSSLYLDDAELPAPLPGLDCADDPGSEGELSNESWVLSKMLLQEEQTPESEFAGQQVESWLNGTSDSSMGHSTPCYGKETRSPLCRYQPISPLPYEHLEKEEHPSGCRELISNIFDYCNVTVTDSSPETLHTLNNEGIRNPASQNLWAVPRMKTQLMGNLEHNQFPHHSHNTSLLQTSQEESTHLELLENHSITGDSGIDSPRTRVSLASNNSIILDSLKRRSLMQNYGTLSSTGQNGVFSQHPLLQLTPVMNV
ncbi:storkhead-box protein 1 isoform X1 [Chiloscyllium plagiosum]|uniref:storkhead-box protein 1 isoform X1 n=2 Tax=Chiloscyllium plagiosum TaxID=36176 RepID=UPI001CB84BE4|nr:storkhead-box protein 1 isoform X1 [Chiloscyllium plagiosum]XP_043539071.1 storkhead-box protein 1 isoform X1 [Chiloscyllium plagiosum]